MEITIGGNIGCVDEFTGQPLSGELTSVFPSNITASQDGGLSSRRMLSNDAVVEVVVTLLSSVTRNWHRFHNYPPAKGIEEIDGYSSTFFGLEPSATTTRFDHIDALANDLSKTIAMGVMSKIAKVDTLIKLGGGYLKAEAAQLGLPKVTTGDAIDFMFQALAYYGYQSKAGHFGEENGLAFDFSKTFGAKKVLEQAIGIMYPPRRRRSLHQTKDDVLNALTDVMLVIFDSIETSGAGSDAKRALEEITKVTIAVETGVLREVEDLTSGVLSPTAFLEDNTKQRIRAKVEAVAVPTTLKEALDDALGVPEPRAPSPEVNEEPKTSSKDDTGMILGIVFGALAGGLLIACVVVVSARRARKSRTTEDSSLPMTIDLSDQLYTPYSKKKKDKKGRKYEPAGSSSLEMTGLRDSQASALA
ncbi:hypothetical protein HOP50_04g32680 [Chloropicon primus]|uniref:Uncharacterized protein n=2 Tax=Chloropicon primus TaxID=1764295 RepID=A0A5B8MJV0_9CHLO|nr:hypothetical protein A3770_04p32640 [Chloropicon primus]UPQ99958.1 hypothetical protein HOP50_04g32680 [Chloropicon primus]|eukprot:QDZ20746.1 hypothetical protein A3770_04p32640 [Chloropicon primus]